jgi:hypothetical protein
VAEDFPTYAPTEDPDEGVWGRTADGRLANFAPADTAQLRERVRAELTWLKQYPLSGIAHAPARAGPLYG